MAAGVPIREHVSGIAMGLISKNSEFVTLTEILGAEDALGDMDFKVAGTRGVITALQLDMKIEGLPSDILRKALEQAKDARHHILDIMEDTISEPAAEVNENAPRLETIELPKDKIGEVIGPKGKNIRNIEETTGVSVEIDDDGILTLGSTGDGDMEAAREIVNNIVNPPEVEVGVEYEGEVVNIATFGGFTMLLTISLAASMSPSPVLPRVNIPSSSISTETPVVSSIFLIFLPFGPITSPILSFGSSIVSSLGAFSFTSAAGSEIVSSIISKI
jgi:polyribonucleotide nucleotidyltransferase